MQTIRGKVENIFSISLKKLFVHNKKDI